MIQKKTVTCGTLQSIAGRGSPTSFGPIADPSPVLLIVVLRRGPQGPRSQWVRTPRGDRTNVSTTIGGEPIS